MNHKQVKIKLRITLHPTLDITCCPPSPVAIPFEPLWYNSHVTHNSNIITDTVIQQYISLCIIKALM